MFEVKVRRISLQLALACAVILAGCATSPPDSRVERVEANAGYRLARELGRNPGNDPETLLLLAFSGGGTRAAAMSYGILETLRATSVEIRGERRRLLDEVDAISGVSGGSFTALAYALYGERLFDLYETRFLKRDVQGELIASMLNPINWPALLWGSGNRSDLAAQLYDRILFEGATYADVVGQGRPLVIVSATDFSSGSRFTFTQETFDLICADLAKFRLAIAATASSAVPVAFAPVILQNWGGTCGLQLPEWITQRGGWSPAETILLRRYLDRNLALENSSERPWLHLVDGGVSDNLGLRSYIDMLQATEVQPDVGRQLGLKGVRRIAVIVVNALSDAPPDWSRSPTGPGLFDTILHAASVPIDQNSIDSIVLLQAMVERWRLQMEARAAESRAENAPTVDLFPIVISFDALPNASDRAFFKSLPTTFALPAETVDRLRAAAGELLTANSEYQRFLKSFGQVP